MDCGFKFVMEYVFIGQHRDAWQNLTAILQSLETWKRLKMKYTAPHVPIDIHQTSESPLRESSRFENSRSSKTDIFEYKKREVKVERRLFQKVGSHLFL
jgi:hypothetical protein